MTRMKTKCIASVLWLACLASLFVCSCKETKTEKSGKTKFEEVLTSEDSTAVVSAINMFFEYCESERVMEAVALLYKQNPNDHYAEPELLDNDEMERMFKIFSSFPIISHKIDYIKFRETYENEAKVTATIAEAQGDMPEVKTVFYFRPFNFLGGWRLCIVDSNSNTGTIVDNSAKDSLTRSYNGE